MTSVGYYCLVPLVLYTAYAILATVCLLLRKGSSKAIKKKVLIRHFVYLFLFITFNILGEG